MEGYCRLVRLRLCIPASRLCLRAILSVTCYLCFPLAHPPFQVPPRSRFRLCSYLKGIDAEEVSTAEQEPSLYALIEAWLERTPFMEHVSSSSRWRRLPSVQHRRRSTAAAAAPRR